MSEYLVEGSMARRVRALRLKGSAQKLTLWLLHGFKSSFHAATLFTAGGQNPAVSIVRNRT